MTGTRTRQSLTWDLAGILAPVDPTSFVEDYWEQRHLYVPREDADYFASLFTIEDADQVLAHSGVDPSNIRVVRDGKDIPVSRLIGAYVNRRNVALESMYDEYRRGATIVLQFLHERWKPLRQLCRALSTDMSAAFQVNVYMTPAGERGLKEHYDTHDVFVLQVAGTKRWRIYSEPVPLPLEGTLAYRDDPDAAEVLEELVLQAGDTLYVPRGWYHDATSETTTSIHLTVGVHPVKVASLLVSALEDVIEAEPELRRSLPIAFMHDTGAQIGAREQLVRALGTAWSRLDPDSIMQTARNLALCATQPALEGHLLDLERAAGIGPSTVVGRRADVHREVGANGKVTLGFHGKIITLPAHTEPQVTYAMQREHLRAEDLPGPLDDAGKLTLVRRLVREGLFTVE